MSNKVAGWEDTRILPFNLILEGGAMRSMFTTGVTDCFIEQGIKPARVIGVSAGALIGLHYIAGYLGHVCYLNVRYAHDWRYLSLKSFLLTGNVYGRSFSFDKLPHQLEPCDFSLVDSSPTRLVSVASNLATGQADYHEYTNIEREMPYLIATSSLPVLSQTVHVDGKPLLDGGTCDSIPINYSISTGAPKHVVILTRDVSYRKKPDQLLPIERVLYKNYPKYIQRLNNRHLEYNQLQQRLEQMHQEGKLFIIRPSEPVRVKHIEKDVNKLMDLYEQGYREALQQIDALKKFIGME